MWSGTQGDEGGSQLQTPLVNPTRTINGRNPQGLTPNLLSHSPNNSDPRPPASSDHARELEPLPAGRRGALHAGLPAPERRPGPVQDGAPGQPQRGGYFPLCLALVGAG